MSDKVIERLQAEVIACMTDLLKALYEEALHHEADLAEMEAMCNDELEELKSEIRRLKLSAAGIKAGEG
jgi:hypothetical protein